MAALLENNTDLAQDATKVLVLFIVHHDCTMGHNVANITNEALSDSEADGDVMDKVSSSGYP